MLTYRRYGGKENDDGNEIKMDRFKSVFWSVQKMPLLRLLRKIS